MMRTSRPQAALRTVPTLVRSIAPLLAALALLWSGDVHATHAVGGEISYTCVAPNQYLVTLDFYRDCNGVAAPTNCNNGLTFNVRSQQCGANFNQCFAFQGVQVITPICATETDRCLSSTGQYGIQKYTYTRLVNLSAYAGCGTDWVFSWSLCCRNNAVTSLQNPGNQNLYLDATLNNTLSPCNNSADFLTDPTPFYCLGQSVSYNPGAVDVDGDQLTYELIAARGANGNNIPYAAGYSATQPIRNGGGAGAVQLNANTGTMTVIPNQLQVAVVTYRVREFRNGVQIGSVTRDVQVVVRSCAGNTAPTASGINGTANFSTSVCAGVPITFTINSSDPNAGQTVQMNWNSGIPGASFTTAGSPFPTGTFSWTPTIADIGTNNFAVTVTDDACPLVGTNDFGYSITVTPPFTPADAGPDQEVCGTTATLAGQLPYAQVTGTWTVVSGSGTFANANAPSSAVTGLSPGANVFQWSVNYGTCGIALDQVTITAFDPGQVPANAGPDQSICLPGTSTNLAANTVAAPATGAWLLVGGTGTLADPNDPATAVTGLSLGANVFRWTVDNGPCGTPSSDEVTILVFDDSQAAASAGTDQQLCTPNTSTSLQGNTVSFPATGTWTLVSGSGTITTPGDPLSGVTGLGVGVNILQWTVDNGPCGTPTTDQVVITVFDGTTPVSDAGPDQQICVPTFPSEVNLQGSAVLPPATGTWTVVSGAGVIADPTNPNTLVTGLTVGTNIFRWTVNNAGCANGLTTDEVSILVFDAANPVANAGPDQGLCTPISSTVLSGSALIAPASGTWTLVSGSGTIVDPSDPNSQVTGLVLGTSVFQWTVSNGNCANAVSSDQVTINIFDGDAQQADAGADQTICSSDGPITTAANAPTGLATGSWSVLQGSAVFADPNDPTTTVGGLAVGTNILEWNINNGACGVSTDVVTITVFDAVQGSADAGPDQSICIPDVPNQVNLAGNAITAPATGIWTLVSGTGNILDPSDPASVVTGLGVGVNVFEWTVDNGPCSNGITTDQVTITVFDGSSATADAGADQELCTPASTTILAASSVIFPSTGTWTVVSGTAVIADPSDPASNVSGLVVGETVLQWTVDNGSCSSGTTSDLVSLFVFDATNAVADAGPDVEFCSPDNVVNMSASPVTFPATGTWTVVSGAGIIVDPSDPNTAVIDLAVGETVLEWTVDNGPCASGITSDQVTIQVYDPQSPVADAGPDQDLCTPTTSTTLAGSVPLFPSIGTWSILSGGGTIADLNDAGTAVSDLPVGVNVFLWTVDNGICPGGVSTDTVTLVLYDENTPPADAGPDQELCTPNTATVLAGSAVIAPGTGQWTLVSGSGILADPADPTTAVTGLSVGENVFEWTVTNGPCANPLTSDQVSIFVFDGDLPVANAGPDQDICTPITSATLAGSAVVFPSTGQWTLVSGQGTITDPSDPNTTVTGLGIGQNEFAWTVDNGPCSSGITADNVVINLFDENAPPAAAGADQELCAPASSTFLAGNTAVGVATGTWTVVQGTGVFADANDPLTEVTGLTVGENIFQWTIDNSVCGISNDQVSILVFDPNSPAAAAGPDQELCVPTDNTLLSGNAPVFPAVGVWTVVAGSGIVADPADPGTSVSNLSIGVNTFRWTLSNGPCADPLTEDEVTVILYDDSTSVPNAGPDQEVCLPLTSTAMSADVPAPPASGTWSLVSGTGTIADPTSPTTAINDLGVGISTFVWTLDYAPCPPNGIVSDTVQIYVYDPAAPLADAGDDQDLCTPQTSTMMQGNTPAVPGVGTWTLVSGSGSIADANDPFTMITDLTVGENVFVWEIYNGQCGFGPPSVDTVSVFLYDADQPPAQAGPDQELCTPTTGAVLTANDPIFPATGQWTVVQGGGGLADPADPNSAVFNLSIGDNVFVWTISNGPCPDAVTSDTLQVTLFDANAPVADAGPDQDICVPTDPNTVTMAAGEPTYPSSGSWTLVSGSGVITDPTSPTTSVTGLQVGVNVFEWSVSNGPCTVGITTDQVVINVFDATQQPADAGVDQQLCAPTSTTTLAGNALTSPASGNWTILSGSGTVTDPSSPTSGVTGLAVGTTVLVWTVDNGPCAQEVTTDTVVIEVFDNTAPDALAGDDQSFCSPAPGATMFASAPVPPATGTWTLVSGNGVLADPSDPFTAVSGLGLGETVFQWTIDNGACGNTSDQMSFLVYDSTQPAADAGEDQEFCQHLFTGTDLDAVPVVGDLASGSWTLVGGTATIADPSDPGTAVNGLALGANWFVWTVDNGVCGSSSDSVLVRLKDCLTVTVPDAFSPNGDGVNDTYVVFNLESYPRNSLQVFNRWGAKVLDRSPYTNDWNGRSENSLNWGEDLPESTYYFILDLGNGDEPFTGYIYIRR